MLLGDLHPDLPNVVLDGCVFRLKTLVILYPIGPVMAFLRTVRSLVRYVHFVAYLNTFFCPLCELLSACMRCSKVEDERHGQVIECDSHMYLVPSWHQPESDFASAFGF